MDIVIPYRHSASNGLELRYTLRGIEKFFPDLENIFIIGDCPEFVDNIIHIPAKDAPERHLKARNIMSKLWIACEDKRVSDTFAMFNDDHFLLKPYNHSYHYSQYLQYSVASYTVHQTYRNTLNNTMAYLNGGKNFDTHCPIIFNKELFVRTVTTADWSKPWGYGIKSLYCNMAGIEGEYYPDLKIKSPFPKDRIVNDLLAGRPYFSIDDRGLNDAMKEVLQELYPPKSIYESH
jgi:hypothetical protein